MEGTFIVDLQRRVVIAEDGAQFNIIQLIDSDGCETYDTDEAEACVVQVNDKFLAMSLTSGRATLH